MAVASGAETQNYDSRPEVDIPEESTGQELDNCECDLLLTAFLRRGSGRWYDAVLDGVRVAPPLRSPDSSVR